MRWERLLRWLIGPGYDEYSEEEEEEEDEITISEKDMIDARIADMYCILKALASKYAMFGRAKEANITIECVKALESVTHDMGRGEVPEPRTNFGQLFMLFFDAAKFVLDNLDDKNKRKLRNDVVWRVYMLFGEYLLDGRLK